jgi:dTDP-4-dehydrorhamnose 3,5-epimerase
MRNRHATLTDPDRPRPVLGSAVEGVCIRPLSILGDDRGAVLHMLRADAPHFAGFGEVYFSRVFPGRIKAWHRHLQVVCNYAVPSGRILLVVHDDRPGSPTRGSTARIETGESTYALVTIPPGTWSGFMGLGDTPALVANCMTGAHDPAEVDRRPSDDRTIPFEWPVTMRVQP